MLLADVRVSTTALAAAAFYDVPKLVHGKFISRDNCAHGFWT